MSVQLLTFDEVAVERVIYGGDEMVGTERLPQQSIC